MGGVQRARAACSGARAGLRGGMRLGRLGRGRPRRDLRPARGGGTLPRALAAAPAALGAASGREWGHRRRRPLHTRARRPAAPPRAAAFERAAPRSAGGEMGRWRASASPRRRACAGIRGAAPTPAPPASSSPPALGRTGRPRHVQAHLRPGPARLGRRRQLHDAHGGRHSEAGRGEGVAVWYGRERVAVAAARAAAQTAPARVAGGPRSRRRRRPPPLAPADASILLGPRRARGARAAARRRGGAMRAHPPSPPPARPRPRSSSSSAAPCWRRRSRPSWPRPRSRRWRPTSAVRRGSGEAARARAERRGAPPTPPTPSLQPPSWPSRRRRCTRPSWSRWRTTSCASTSSR